jgi:hypothetical protein
VLWNPDLIILGTQNYNPHPETGMISVTDAHNLIRRWNAKEGFIVHYSGLQDLEESKNQWFRGPTKPMTTDKLQNTINSSIPITGGNDFKITVAEEGMIYNLENLEQDLQQYASNFPIGRELIIESIQKYVVRFEKDSEKDKLKLMIEDRIDRSDLSFDKPRKDPNYNNIVHAEGEKGMMARGPSLTMELVEDEAKDSKATSSAIIRIHVYKGSKDIFNDGILIHNKDAIIFRKYILENF